MVVVLYNASCLWCDATVDGKIKNDENAKKKHKQGLLFFFCIESLLYWSESKTQDKMIDTTSK